MTRGNYHYLGGPKDGESQESQVEFVPAAVHCLITRAWYYFDRREGDQVYFSFVDRDDDRDGSQAGPEDLPCTGDPD